MKKRRNNKGLKKFKKNFVLEKKIDFETKHLTSNVTKMKSIQRKSDSSLTEKQRKDLVIKLYGRY